MSNSLMIGDQHSDIAAGLAAGVKAYQFNGGDLAEFVAPHILASARWNLKKAN
jgi:histidinol phosphatase-like enzyme